MPEFAMKVRPGPCHRCGSEQFIPIVTGTLARGGMLDQLSAIGLASPWGCFDFEAGIPLWECAECGQAYNVEGFRWRDGLSPQEKEYKCIVDELYRSFRPLEEEQLKVYRGRRLLKGLLTSEFTETTKELRFFARPLGFCLEALQLDGKSMLAESEYFSANMYLSICAFIDSLSKDDAIRFAFRTGTAEKSYLIRDSRPDGHGIIVTRETTPFR